MKHHTQKKGKQVAIPKRIDSRSLAVSGHLSAINPEVITTIIPNDFFQKLFNHEPLFLVNTFLGVCKLIKNTRLLLGAVGAVDIQCFFCAPQDGAPKILFS